MHTPACGEGDCDYDSPNISIYTFRIENNDEWLQRTQIEWVDAKKRFEIFNRRFEDWF